MNEVQLFNFENHEVRSLLINSEPWFFVKDAADVLGYSNSRKALNDHVDAEDKEVLTSRNVTLENIPNRGITVVNESGLYSLILSSKLPSANKFKRWVTSKILTFFSILLATAGTIALIWSAAKSENLNFLFVLSEMVNRNKSFKLFL